MGNLKQGLKYKQIPFPRIIQAGGITNSLQGNF